MRCSTSAPAFCSFRLAAVAPQNANGPNGVCLRGVNVVQAVADHGGPRRVVALGAQDLGKQILFVVQPPPGSAP